MSSYDNCADATVRTGNQGLAPWGDQLPKLILGPEESNIDCLVYLPHAECNLDLNTYASVLRKGNLKASDFPMEIKQVLDTVSNRKVYSASSHWHVENMLHLLKCIYTQSVGLILVWLILYFQILFTITFWLLLRQHLTEQKALQEKEALLSEVKIETQEIEEKGKLVCTVCDWRFLCSAELQRKSPYASD